MVRFKYPPKCTIRAPGVRSASMKGNDDLTARLAALIADQERLLRIIRDKQTKLIRMDLAASLRLPTSSVESTVAQVPAGAWNSRSGA